MSNYLTKINSKPMLSEADELALVTRHRNGDRKAFELLYESYLRIVPNIARKYSNNFDFDDLIQEGNIALMKSIESYDPAFNTRLSGYAMKWVRYAIQEYTIQHWGIMKLFTTKDHRKIFYNLWLFKSKIRSTEGRVYLTNADIQEFAKIHSVSVDDVLDVDMRLNTQSVSFDSDPDEFIGADVFLADDTSNPETIMMSLERLKIAAVDIPSIVDRLNDREKDIIRSRWIDLTPVGTPVKLTTLAEKYGISIERTRQVEVKAMETIRKELRK